MANHEAPLSPDLLLRRAAAGDATRAVELLSMVGPTRLLDAVLTQAELAVDDERPRAAGIDAIAELDRAAIEVMGLPQGTPVDLDPGGPATDTPGGEAGASEPVLVGWELATVRAEDLEDATLTIEARPWQLALVAFADLRDHHDQRYRRVVSAAADGRLVGGQLRFRDPDADPDLLDAVVTRDPGDLADDAALATALFAALRGSAHGV